MHGRRRRRPLCPLSHSSVIHSSSSFTLLLLLLTAPSAAHAPPSCPPLLLLLGAALLLVRAALLVLPLERRDELVPPLLQPRDPGREPPVVQLVRLVRHLLVRQRIDELCGRQARTAPTSSRRGGVSRAVPSSSSCWAGKLATEEGLAGCLPVCVRLPYLLPAAPACRASRASWA